MKLQEIFDQLTYGELSQLAIGGGEQGEISEANYPRVLAHINLGLTALYKRFRIKESRILIGLTAGTMSYPLKSEHSVSNRRSRETLKFIRDSTAAPFEDDIHKVERVYTDAGYELDLNNHSNPYSLFTPSALVLRVPELMAESSITLPDELQTETLDVVYRANHKKIAVSAGFFDPKRIEVELPDSHLQALLMFVASRVNNPIGMSNEFHAGNSYAAKYEMECKQLENENVLIDQGSQGTGFQRNGWV